ncbi:hypothetical protein [Streptomyces sp. NBC_00566]|uniref:hypothetical protein n=1 Tax=Streptomyces sp. NBC_00566 TaxID=2975778 RepID=UPI002E8228CB|nr:hypothetical protein [Streptomyces sp. NBC_00566]WUB90329.1 hypothetical protein OG812_28625 [Streptomyces sp. NBC_00566]
MFPTFPSRLRRTALAAALVLPAALLGGCSLVRGGGSCEDSGAARKDLAAQPVLSSHPAGAVDPANYRGAGISTGCDDDSPGTAWLHADRVYAFTGARKEVVDHYTRTAAAQGWRVDPAARADAACWTRTAGGRHLVLAVDFQLGAWSPAPDPGRGIAYEVTVGSNAEGSAQDAGCAD